MEGAANIQLHLNVVILDYGCVSRFFDYPGEIQKSDLCHFQTFKLVVNLKCSKNMMRAKYNYLGLSFSLQAVSLQPSPVPKLADNNNPCLPSARMDNGA